MTRSFQTFSHHCLFPWDRSIYILIWSKSCNLNIYECKKVSIEITILYPLTKYISYPKNDIKFSIINLRHIFSQMHWSIYVIAEVWGFPLNGFDRKKIPFWEHMTCAFVSAKGKEYQSVHLYPKLIVLDFQSSSLEYKTYSYK